MDAVRIHVLPENTYWTVRVSGSPTALSTHPTREEALEAGRREARVRGCELWLHGETGELLSQEEHREEGKALRNKLMDFLHRTLRPKASPSEEWSDGYADEDRWAG